MNQLLNVLHECGLYLGMPLALIAVAAWTYRPSARKRYLDDGNIPFDDEAVDDKTRKGGF